jgi:hypothetical protein
MTLVAATIGRCGDERGTSARTRDVKRGDAREGEAR